MKKKRVNPQLLNFLIEHGITSMDYTIEDDGCFVQIRPRADRRPQYTPQQLLELIGPYHFTYRIYDNDKVIGITSCGTRENEAVQRAVERLNRHDSTK